MDVNTLPKVELHCHLDGILDRAMARAIRQDDPTFPVDPAEFERAYPVEGKEGFVGWWASVAALDGKLACFYPIIGKYIERLKAQNVRYFEVMIASGELPVDTSEAVEKVGAFREWVNQQEGGAIQVEFLVAISRSLSPEAMAVVADRVLRLYEAGLIVGIAIAGFGETDSVRPFARTFARLHEAGLGVEIHGGEWTGPESVWDALEYGYADRIGHGVRLFEDARLLDVVRERRVHIEFCPTSNIKTSSVAHMEAHPIGRARELGLNFSINTDDPGPCECSMASEYQLVSDVFGFVEDDFLKVYTNALAARFQPTLRINPYPTA